LKIPNSLIGYGELKGECENLYQILLQLLFAIKLYPPLQDLNTYNQLSYNLSPTSALLPVLLIMSK
jgi:hypothetical protein